MYAHGKVPRVHSGKPVDEAGPGEAPVDPGEHVGVAGRQEVHRGDGAVGPGVPEELGRRLGVDWNPLGDGFTWDAEDLEASRAKAEAAWAATRGVLASGDYQLVVLDELTYPMNWGWIDTAEVVQAIADRPPAVNVVATGRDAPAELLEVADTVTEMRKLRHAYDSGVLARRGIDY